LLSGSKLKGAIMVAQQVEDERGEREQIRFEPNVVDSLDEPTDESISYSSIAYSSRSDARALEPARAREINHRLPRSDSARRRAAVFYSPKWRYSSAETGRRARRATALRLESIAEYGRAMSKETRPLIGIIMGSKSDWETMLHADQMLTRFGVPHECQIVSAHRTPDSMRDYATSAESRGLEVLIAGAGGAAHLPGMVAAYTMLPVLGVPVQSQALSGLDSLLSIVQMPGGVPVATLAIGKAGAVNAALLATSILAIGRPDLREKLRAFREEQRQKVLGETLP
jgi:5-(carboxyamino)imidazole ribonucleotide mutase